MTASLKHLFVFVVLLAASVTAFGFDWPKPAEADYVIRDFKFDNGQSLPEVKIHYLTWGEPKRDAHGKVNNAILILHSTGGSSGQRSGSGSG